MGENYFSRFMKCAIHIFLMIIYVPTLQGKEQLQCPNLAENPFCTCYIIDKGLRLKCPNAKPDVIRNVLLKTKGTINALTLYDFEKSVTELNISTIIPSHVKINNLEITRSGLTKVIPSVFQSVRKSLVSLKIVASKLNSIPHETLIQLFHIETIDFQLNDIKYLQGNAFKDLKLKEVNLRGNKIANISENAFLFLEKTLAELDLSENFLETFPLQSLIYLKNLTRLRVLRNKLNTIPDHINATVPKLITLDLSSNVFSRIDKNWFKSMPNLKTLVFVGNEIKYIAEEAFFSLQFLTDLDLSRNKIINIGKNTFQRNLNIKSVDLRYNHLHHINGIFSNLKHLSEIFLFENNILELNDDAFYKTIELTFLNIESNAIRLLRLHCFDYLNNLRILRIGHNFIKTLPSNLFQFNRKLEYLSLDHNEIKELDDSVFDKLVSVKILRLQNNKLTHINGNVFRPLTGLSELHLQENSIKSIDSDAFVTLKKLEFINLEYNELNIIGDVLPNSSLTHIMINSNFLSLIKESFLKGQINLQVIELSENNIKMLTPFMFSDLTNIQLLQLKNNSIMHIENRTFVNLKKIIRLELSLNKISEIHNETFYNLVTLQELLLKSNNIKQIAKDSFKYLVKLRILDLSENEIFTLNFNIGSLPIKEIRLNQNVIATILSDSLGILPHLNVLELKMNYLTWEDIIQVTIPGLKSLVLSNNDFTNLGNSTFSHLVSLQSLNLEMSNISHLPSSIFIKNQNLLKINLAYNNLNELEENVFAYTKVLQELNLKGNQFTNFPVYALFNVSSLESIDLSQNKLRMVDFIQFQGMHDLKSLNLSQNNIYVLYGFKSPSLTNLISLNLSKNRITQLPENFLQHSASLEHIDLSNNLFKFIPTGLSEPFFPALRSLNMSFNTKIEQIIKTFPIKQFPKLEELVVTNTEMIVITSLDFDYFQSLKKLILSNNVINILSPGAFLKLNKLELLDLNNNELEIFANERGRGLFSVQTINISRNIITELEEFTSDLQKLQILDISFNKIKKINRSVFINLFSLRELYLNGNRLTVVTTNLFAKLRKISHIDLSRNDFQVVQMKMLDHIETQIESISFDENPLDCDCITQKLWRWMHDHHKIILKGSSHLRCKNPEELHGLSFLEITPQKLCDIPVVVRIALQDIQTYSVLVSWQSRHQPGLNGYQVAYFGEHMTSIVRGKILNSTARTTRLNHLTPGARYVICVIAIVDFDNTPASTMPNARIALSSLENSGVNVYGDELIFTDLRSNVMNDSHISKCTTVSTLEIFSTGLESPKIVGILEIVTRRLSLVVGCCISLIVFVVFASVLGYVQKKKRPVLPKIEVQQPVQYRSYDNFAETNLDSHSGNLDINTISTHISI
ncbi:protein artichoke-like [Pararge aegeria]|uniref:protein artichoke-like n=1 Tax=Pararge aegeria TaxID=116150 RepID=UPI0019D2EB91|nr:protein artichoke-like [Pararge aegeria]